MSIHSNGNLSARSLYFVAAQCIIISGLTLEIQSTTELLFATSQCSNFNLVKLLAFTQRSRLLPEKIT